MWKVALGVNMVIASGFCAQGVSWSEAGWYVLAALLTVPFTERTIRMLSGH